MSFGSGDGDGACRILLAVVHFRTQDAIKMKVMKSTVLRAVFGLAALFGASGAHATVIGYLGSNSGSSSNWDISLPLFNPSLGTLTGVELYFYTSNTIQTLNLTNTASSGGVTDFAVQLAVDPFGNSYTNTANANDQFTDENMALYSTNGTPTNQAKTILGDCYNVGSNSAVAPGNCTTVNLNPGQEYDFAGDAGSLYPNGFSVSNIASAYSANQTSSAVTKLTVGTGVRNLTGATLAGTNISTSYVGTGNFDLEGQSATLFLANISGTSQAGHYSQNYNVLSTYQAEVDYTYTPNPAPEPATMGLMGSALIGLALVARKFVRR